MLHRSGAAAMPPAIAAMDRIAACALDVPQLPREHALDGSELLVGAGRGDRALYQLRGRGTPEQLDGPARQQPLAISAAAIVGRVPDHGDPLRQRRPRQPLRPARTGSGIDAVAHGW